MDDTAAPATGSWKPIGGSTTERWIGHDASDRFPVYTRGNAGEVYPEVFTPLTFSLAAEAAENAMRRALISTGFVRRSELADVPLTTAVGMGVFGGYAYLNLSLQRLISARAPGTQATDVDVKLVGTRNSPPHVPGPGERNLRGTAAGLRYVWRTMHVTALPELAADQRAVDAFLASLPRIDDATDTELRHSMATILPLFSLLFERHLVVSYAAGAMIAVVADICDWQLGQPLLASQLMAGLGDVDSAAPSQALWDLSRQVAAAPLAAQFDAGIDGLSHRLRHAAPTEPAVARFVTGFDSFLTRYGWRGPMEWDMASDTWETDPALALTLIDRMRATDASHNPVDQTSRMATQARLLEIECLARLPRRLRGLFHRALASARFHSRARERAKSTVIRAIHGVRLRAMELDQRLVERSGGQRGDLWFLVEPEIDAYLADPTALAGTIAQRRDQHRRLAERVPPFCFSGRQPPLEQWPRRDEPMAALTEGQTLTGLPGCPGRARGRARIVTNPADPGRLAPGDVLVVPLTDPAWTPLFVTAEAVVVDVGAFVSHAAIVSRELGVPCVVSATDATRCIPEGALIEVDGSAGVVTLVALPPTPPRP